MIRFFNLAKWKNKNYATISLIIIFAILLIQTAVLMFMPNSNSTELTQLDTVFRTTLSSIFGFFMSSSALSEGKKEKFENVQQQNKIGFTDSTVPEGGILKNSTEEMIEAPSDGISELVGGVALPVAVQKEVVKNHNLQILLLMFTCLFCLIAMMAVRFFSHLVGGGSYVVVTLSLYRDFISGSIGAIIGLARR